jgi:membrane protein
VRDGGSKASAGRIAASAKAVFRQQGAQQLGLVASGAAFWLVISAAPVAVAVVSLYGLIVDPGRVAGDLGNLANAAPASLGALIRAQLQRVAATDGTQLTIGLVVSVALAVWSASAGIYNLDRAIRDAYGLQRQRYVEARARSLAAAAILVVVLGAVALTTAATLAHSRGALAVAVGIPSVFIGVAAALTGLYRFALGQPTRLSKLLPGAVAAAAGMIALLIGFGAYTSASTHFTAVYGAFGAAVIGMVATYLAVYATLLGAVLNVVLARTQEQRA